MYTDDMRRAFHNIIPPKNFGISLEDNELSMNHRVKLMKNERLIKPITFVNQCPQINFGFEESVDNWYQQVKNPRLVIIDTFQKIKPMSGNRNANAYEIDYHILGKLHSLALNNKILIDSHLD